LDQVENLILQLRIRVIKQFLKHIIPKFVVHQLEKEEIIRLGINLFQPLKNTEPELIAREYHRFLSDMTPAFCQTKRNEILLKDFVEIRPHMIWSVLQKMLHDVISVLAIA